MSTNPTPKYSLVVITKNAATQLKHCIESVANADEIIIVDSGSTDSTKEIASSFGARVIEQEWLGFGPQKQFAVSQAKNDWVLCLDADEALTHELNQDISRQLSKGQFKCFRMARRNRFLGRDLLHGEGYPDWNIRLFHRGFAQWSNHQVHEHVISHSDVGTLSGDMLHDSALEITAYLQKQNTYTSIQAQIMFNEGKRATAAKLLLSPVLRFIKFYFFRLGLLDGLPGFVHICIGCFNGFIKYAKLIELGRSTKQSATPVTRQTNKSTDQCGGGS